MRLDLLLVNRKLALSRTHAQELIGAGQVFLVAGEQRKILTKASQRFEKNTNIEVKNGPANRFVSRGGLKLEGALARLNLSVVGLNILDVGISTGGFTDCLLQNHAASVLGIDVGHGQLSSALVGHPRLQLKEGINARQLSLDPVVNATVFDLIVMDVSFISVTLIIPELAGLLKDSGYLLSLIKPQFEVGAEGLGKGGIVKDTSLYIDVENKVKTCCQANAFSVLDFFESPIVGKEGNREFFIFAQKKV